MLLLRLTRGCGDRSPLTTGAALEGQKRSGLDGAAAALVLALQPDEALVISRVRWLVCSVRSTNGALRAPQITQPSQFEEEEAEEGGGLY